MTPVLRRIFAAIAGLIAAFVVIVVIESVCVMLFPLPPGVDSHDPESLKAAMPAMPAGALAGVVLAWVVGTAVGSFTGAKIDGTATPGAVVGVATLAAAVITMVSLPHPVWVWLAALVLVPAATALGIRLATRRAA
jgi:hypothetical protein